MSLALRFVLTPCRKAWLDLAALALILGGTAVITLVGAPALAIQYLTDDRGAALTNERGEPLVVGFDMAAADARAAYLQWAWPGLGLITLGMLWQAVGPAQTILRSRADRAPA